MTQETKNHAPVIDLEIFEREFFISRIISGYLRYKDCGETLKIVSPNIDIQYESNEIYMDIYKSARENDVLSQEDVFSMLSSKGLWSDYEDNQLEEVLPKHVEYWKQELFKNYHDKIQREKIRTYLKVAETELNKLFHKKHVFDHLSTKGLATFARWQFIIENCTLKIDDTKYDWSSATIQNILEYVNINTIPENSVRCIARTEPWRTTWVAGKRISSTFSLPSTRLSDDQKRLINWSGLYDSVHEYPDAPTDEIIADNDAMDGWLIIKSKDSEREKSKSAIEKRIGNNAAGEVFVVATDSDDAKKIYDMNDPSTRNIIKNRQELIAKSDNELNDLAFSDVKRDLTIQANKQAIDAVRKRK